MAGITKGGKAVKCISVRQPHADLIVFGWKDVENRTFKTKYRGPLAIHASKEVDMAAIEWVESVPDLARFAQPSALGAVIGVVDLYDVTDKRTSEWHEEGKIGYYLRNKMPLPKPVPAKGKLGFWDIKDELVQPLTLGGLMTDQNQEPAQQEAQEPTTEQERVIVHCAIMCGKAYAIREDGAWIVKEELEATETDPNEYFSTKDFLDVVDAETKGLYEIRIHLDPATPEMMEACRKMEELESVDEQEAQENDPADTKLKSEHEATDGEVCMAEIECSATESERQKDRLIIDIDRIKEEAKDVAKDYRDQIENLTKRLISLAKSRPMTHAKAIVRCDWERGFKDFVDPATGEILKSVQITDSDRQMQMDLQAPEAPETPEPEEPTVELKDIISRDGDLELPVVIEEESRNREIKFAELVGGMIFKLGNSDVRYMASGEPFENEDKVLCIKAFELETPDAEPASDDQPEQIDEEAVAQ